jgi:hypothetical protein
MANGEVFKESGRVNVIEAEFNNETGTILSAPISRIQMVCSDMAERATSR